MIFLETIQWVFAGGTVLIIVYLIAARRIKGVEFRIMILEDTLFDEKQYFIEQKSLFTGNKWRTLYINYGNGPVSTYESYALAEKALRVHTKKDSRFNIINPNETN